MDNISDATDLTLVSSCACRADKETAARITEEISNLMKEIETLVEEKSKESSDLAKIEKDGKI